jgi:hypothetical protein
VFTAQYGLIPYIKQITFSLLKVKATEPAAVTASVTNTSNMERALSWPHWLADYVVILPYCCQPLCVKTAPSTVFSQLTLHAPCAIFALKKPQIVCMKKETADSLRNLGICCHITWFHIPVNLYRSVTLLLYLFCSL